MHRYSLNHIVLVTYIRQHANHNSFFNDATFSDVKIKFSGQEILAHKSTLARKSEYFFKAFTGQFPVLFTSLNLINMDANLSQGCYQW